MENINMNTTGSIPMNKLKQTTEAENIRELSNFFEHLATKTVDKVKTPTTSNLNESRINESIPSNYGIWVDAYQFNGQKHSGWAAGTENGAWIDADAADSVEVSNETVGLMTAWGWQGFINGYEKTIDPERTRKVMYKKVHSDEGSAHFTWDSSEYGGPETGEPHEYKDIYMRLKPFGFSESKLNEADLKVLGLTDGKPEKGGGANLEPVKTKPMTESASTITESYAMADKAFNDMFHVLNEMKDKREVNQDQYIYYASGLTAIRDECCRESNYAGKAKVVQELKGLNELAQRNPNYRNGRVESMLDRGIGVVANINEGVNGSIHLTNREKSQISEATGQDRMNRVKAGESNTENNSMSVQRDAAEQVKDISTFLEGIESGEIKKTINEKYTFPFNHRGWTITLAEGTNHAYRAERAGLEFFADSIDWMLQDIDSGTAETRALTINERRLWKS